MIKNDFFLVHLESQSTLQMLKKNKQKFMFWVLHLKLQEMKIYKYFSQFFLIPIDNVSTIWHVSFGTYLYLENEQVILVTSSFPQGSGANLMEFLIRWNSTSKGSKKATLMAYANNLPVEVIKA